MKLRGYQSNAAVELHVRKRVYLLSEPGSGKTAIATAAIKLSKPFLGPFLVIAPKLVAKTVWPQEIKKWMGEELKVVLIEGTPEQRKALLKQPAHVYVINYELMPWLAKLPNVHMIGLILDEISRVKTPNKARFKAILPFAEKATFVWGLTGTPLSTSLLDLFGQYRMIDGGVALGKYITHYKQQYFYSTDPDGWRWEPRVGAEKEIYERIKPVTLHIKDHDMLDIAKVFYNRIDIELGASEQEKYKELVEEFVLDLPNGQLVTAENAAVLTGKLSQYTGGGLYEINGNYYRISDTKFEALDELLTTLEGHPTLIVYAYRGEAKSIRDNVKNTYWLGNASLPDEKLIEMWNNKDIPYLLIHPSSAGHGLNLQAGGHHIIWYGGTWSQEMYRQTNARIARSGQEHPVYVHHLLVKDTIDVLQYNVMQDRIQMQEALIEGITNDS